MAEVRVLPKRGEAPGRRALVLGPRIVARSIADQLSKLGFEAWVQEDWKPHARLLGPKHPEGLASLERMLRDFRRAGNAWDVVHPGISAWADRPVLLSLGKELELEVIAPSERVLALFANKLGLLTEAERIGIPNLMLTKDPFQTVQEIGRWLDERPGALPLVLKGVWSGSAQWIRVLQNREQLEREIPLWHEEYRKRSGEPLLLLERYLEGARQVCVPFTRFHDGTIQFFPRVDTTLQLKSLRLISLCPATFLDPDLDSQLLVMTKKLADRCGYVGLGNLYFLVEGDRAFLVDGLARLSLDSVVWEMAAGVSSVEWQLRAHEGEATSGGGDWSSTQRKHIAAARWIAQDSWNHLPQPGAVHELQVEPEDRDWTRVGIEVDQEVDAYGTSVLGLVLAEGKTRQDCLKALRDRVSRIWVAGTLQTNLRYLQGVLDHPWVREGIVHAGFLDEEYVAQWPTREELLRCAVAVAREGRLSSAPQRWRCGPVEFTRDEIERSELVTAGRRSGQDPTGKMFSGSIRSGASRAGKSESASSAQRFYAVERAPHQWLVHSLGTSWTLRALYERPAVGKRTRTLNALCSGRVYALLYRTGTMVAPHQPLLLLESLNELVAHAIPLQSKVLEWKVESGQEVYAGQELAILELGAASSPHSVVSSEHAQASKTD